MELFSEVYSAYYRAVEHLLAAACERPLTAAEMERMIGQYAFSESAMFILPKIQSGEWALFEPQGAGWRSKTGIPPQMPLTNLQRAWLKAMLQNPRIRLFLDDDEIQSLSGSFGGMEPMYGQSDFCSFDRGLDPDDFDAPSYIANFRTLLHAVRTRKMLELCHGEKHYPSCCALRLQYAPKEDRFYAYLAVMGEDEPTRIHRCALREITKLEWTGRTAQEPVDLEAHLLAGRAEDPALLRISEERGGLERCMMQFASYEKQTEFDEESGRYLCRIFYDRTEEDQLLDEICSFGRVVRLLGPPMLLERLRERLRRQCGLMERAETFLPYTEEEAEIC